MRILIVLHQFYPEFSGGTEHVALNLARTAQHTGHYVHVLACSMNESDAATGEFFRHLVYQGVPVTLIRRALLPPTADYSFDTEAALADRLSGWMRQHRFDVAHVLHLMRMGTALLALQHSRIPYLLTLTDFFAACYRVNLIDQEQALCSGPEGGARCGHTCLEGPWTAASLISRHRQARDILAGAGARVCPSDFVATRFREAFPNLDFQVIPHGIHFTRLAELTPRAGDPEIALTTLNLGFIGMIGPHKGLDVLLRAFAQVPHPHLRLYLIGDAYSNTPYLLQLKQLAATDQRVIWRGRLSHEEVFRVLQHIDLLCVPSRVPETFCLAMHEAALAGVPALVSNLGAPAEAVTRNGSGRILPAGDVNAWASAIAELAENRQILETWRRALKLPLRVEEEAFFYESLYRRMLHAEGTAS